MRALLLKFVVPRLYRSGWRLTFALACLASVSAYAYDDRVALVIGNDSYINEPLKNAVNDARAMQKVLQDLGFKVLFKPNADIQTMRAAAVQFAKQMDGASAAVFYYAGHGIQYSNKNYLIPIDAKLTAEQEIAYFALEVNQILDSMEEAKVRHKFIILDACRSNPFRNLSVASGLAKSARVPPGTTISYAAAAGAIALDGDGENGLYTKHLVREIRIPGQTESTVFANVGSNVAQESNSRQNPENQSTASPRGAFLFAGANLASVSNGGISGDTNALVDKEFWSSVKDSRKVEDYEAYLSQFRTGIFATLARNRIENIKQERSLQQVAIAPSSRTEAVAQRVIVADKAPEVSTRPMESSAAPVKLTAPQTIVTTSASPAAVPAAAPASSAFNTANAVDSQPIRLASAAPAIQTSEVRGMESKPAAPGMSLPAAAASIPASTTAPAANHVAVLSPEQKTSLPPPPAFPKILSGALEFADGARYVGGYKEDQEKNQTLHGRGEYISNAFRYEGEFRDGKKQGKGVYIWANGDKFDGEFANDQVSGKGKWEFASGDVYEGDVLNAIMAGKGVLVTKSGDKYEGMFADGKPHGQGVYIFASGDRFEGSMAAGKMAGNGVYVSKSGDKILAPFIDNVAHGAGTYEFANGDRYVGQIQNGLLTGKGKYFHSDGQRSEGSYVNGLLNGDGKFFYNNGSMFEGTFEGGFKRAKGLMIQSDGSKRKAVIVNGETTFPEG
ncbi:MAG: caspase family protein [Betaproteobacteria bacterium]|nr:caspase family protein [Betaproteobacteria bacterium]